MFETLKIKKMAEAATLPTRAHPGDAGLDLYGAEDALIEPKQGKLLRTGIAIELEPGFVGLVADRSSLAKRGLKTAGGVIDSGYRGEIHIVLWNISGEPIHIKAGERVAQLLIIPVATPAVQEATELNDTSRGAKGFGSSGK